MRYAAILLALAVTGCRSRSVDNRMWNHYQHVATVEGSVIGTNLDAARSTARWVATHQDSRGMPAAALPYLDSMRTAALEVANAADLEIASLATARMGAACGSCHVATGLGPRITHVGTPPASGDTVVPDRMAYHLWAVNRMWDGLTGPSDNSWAEGAVALTDVPQFQRHIRRAGPPAAFADSMAQRLHALGIQAPMAGRAQRTDLYAQVLTTCSACHKAYHVVLPEAGVLAGY